MIYPAENEKDFALIESLAREIWIEHYTPIIGKSQVEYMLKKFQSKEAISAQTCDFGYLYFIIKECDNNLGYIGIVQEENELVLSKIYVKSSKRQKGYGKEAIQFVELFCKENGINKIILTVNKNNKTSINFYEKMGFKNIESLVQDIGNGFVMDDYKMEKLLSDKK